VSVAQPVQSNSPQAVVSRSLAVQSEVRKRGGGRGSAAAAIGHNFVLSMSHPAGRNAHWLGSYHLTTGSLGQVHSSSILLIAVFPTFYSSNPNGFTAVLIATDMSSTYLTVH